MDPSSKQKETLVDVADDFLLLHLCVLVESIALYSFVFLFESKMALFFFCYTVMMCKMPMSVLFSENMPYMEP